MKLGLCVVGCGSFAKTFASSVQSNIWIYLRPYMLAAGLSGQYSYIGESLWSCCPIPGKTSLSVLRPLPNGEIIFLDTCPKCLNDVCLPQNWYLPPRQANSNVVGTSRGPCHRMVQRAALRKPKCHLVITCPFGSYPPF